MNILGTTITTNAEHTTERGLFQIAYSISNNTLGRLHAEIFKVSENGDKSYVGYITYEGRNMHCSIESDGRNAAYFTDFEAILTTVSEGLTPNEDLEQQQSTNNVK